MFWLVGKRLIGGKQSIQRKGHHLFKYRYFLDRISSSVVCETSFPTIIPEWNVSNAVVGKGHCRVGVVPLRVWG